MLVVMLQLDQCWKADYCGFVTLVCWLCRLGQICDCWFVFPFKSIPKMDEEEGLELLYWFFIISLIDLDLVFCLLEDNDLVLLLGLISLPIHESRSFPELAMVEKSAVEVIACWKCSGSFFLNDSIACIHLKLIQQKNGELSISDKRIITQKVGLKVTQIIMIRLMDLFRL